MIDVQAFGHAHFLFDKTNAISYSDKSDSYKDKRGSLEWQEQGLIKRL